jgi:hypothetical protein
MEETTNAYKVLVRNLEGDVALARPRQRWKNKVTIRLFQFTHSAVRYSMASCPHWLLPASLQLLTCNC